MRSFLAGILLAILPAVAFAQARGGVETIGFGDYFRPATWTPMLVSLTPTTGTTFNGRLEVVQEDLDRDEVIFTRQISLTGTPPNGTAVDQKYWMYFMPQPNRDRGELSDTLTTAELTGLIKVRLVSDSGKQLLQLPITRTLRPVGLRNDAVGQKIVLCVYDKSPPNFSEYQLAVTRGLAEEVVPATARNLATDLPDNVIGYDAIDAILWTDADPSKLSADQLSAIEQYVRRGGKLVISQDTTTNQWQRNNVAFPLLMPVTVRGVEERDDALATLRDLAKIPEPTTLQALTNPWDRLRGPFRYATAQVKSGATVVIWQKDAKGNVLLDDAGKAKPYAVRGPAGAGSVTWVAQDLSDRQILGERDSTSGWPLIWDPIFDWHNEPIATRGRDTRTDLALVPYREGTTWELGRAYLKYMDLNSTSAALVGIALLFFVVYWVAAGPGSYLVLARKGKSMLSWFTFAAIALGATGLTVGIVKLVLRGAPQLRHFSVVRMVPNEPIRVHSDFGLYIPRDGMQRIELKDAAANRSSYVTAFNLHPVFNNNSDDFPAHQTYYIPVRQIQKGAADTMDPRSIDVPYRSTLKKFQAEWIGATAALPAGIEGSVTLAHDHPLVHGTLANHTGHDLKMVYLVVHHPLATPGAQAIGGDAHDLVLFVSSWPDGSTLNLTELFDIAGKKGSAPYLKSNKEILFDSTSPNTVKTYKGFILPDRVNYFGNWTDYWFSQGWRVSGIAENREYEERQQGDYRAFPLLSFYERLPISRNDVRDKDRQGDRFDLLRRGIRELDLSPAISSGNMGIIAVSASDEEKLPFPLEVQGDRIEGKGTVYYQFVVPVDRSAVQTNPASAATQPKGKAEG